MTQGMGSIPQLGIFEGVRVIDFGHILAAPVCAMHMSDLGAEVIKVERPETGDGMRHIAAECFSNGVSGLFLWRNAGKKSISLDMKNPKAIEVFKDLVRVSDVVLQNMRVGAVDRLGLGYEDLQKINPRIIMCSISGYGQSGPLSDWPANDLNIQAMSGIATLGGEPDRAPAPCWVSWVDSATATHALATISGALYYREKTGLGQHIEVSMMEVAFTYHDFPVLEYLWSDGQVHRTRNGAMNPTQGGMGVFTCRDGYLVIAATNDRAWGQLADLMERPELAVDSRFDTQPHRNDNKDEVNRLISEWIKQFDAADARIILEENGIVATPVLSIEDLVNHPHIEARGMLEEVDDPRAGKVKIPGTAFRFSVAKTKPRRGAPLIGEHNEEVLANVLGYSQERIAQLWEERVLYADQPVSRD